MTPGRLPTRRPPARLARALLALAATVVVATVVTAIASATSAPSVLAHAELIRTSPAAGERLAESPTTIELEFTEGVSVVGDAIRLLDATGSEVEIGEPVGSGTIVRAEVSGLPEGGYVVDWRVVSADGHPITGAFTFAVGDADLPAAPGGSSTGSTDQGLLVPILRALTYAGLAALIGVTAFVLWCWPDARRHTAVGALLAAAAGVTTLAAALRVPAEAAVLDATLSEVVDLRSGRAWVALAVIGAIGFGVAPLLRSRAGRSTLLASWAVYSVAAGLAVAYAGHGASGRAPLLGTGLTVVHLVVASVWVGGLVGLAQCVLGSEATTARRAAARYSSLATVCLAAVVATGAAQSVRQVGGLDNLGSTSYGRSLLVKIAVVAALAVVAVLSRRTVRRRDDQTHLKNTSLPQTLAVETGLAVVVFFATGWLAGEPPAETAGETAGDDSAVVADEGVETTASQDGVNVLVRLTPAVVGANRLELAVLTDDGRTPDDLDVGLTPADGAIATIEVELDVAAPGRATADVDVPYAGSWIVEIDARFGDFDLTELDVPVNVQPEP